MKRLLMFAIGLFMLGQYFSLALSMSKRSHQFAFVALALWLLGSWLGAHGHFCFDGQEPPVSVHMHMLGDHPEHHADEDHQDADVDLLQSAIAKLTKLDQSLLLLAVVALLLVFQRTPIPASHYSPFVPVHIPFARPLLRAPPLTA
jgi:disulfide bond formation protein DsbB